MMTAPEAIALAAHHAQRSANARGSSELCLADARACLERGDWRHAIGRAAASLRYSVGVFHSDYSAVAEAHNAVAA